MAVKKTPVKNINGFEKFMLVASMEDRSTLSIMLTYESVRKNRTGVKVYNVFTRGIDPRMHKSWRLFEKTRKFCDENEFPYEEFILAQFIEMGKWSKCPIPYPNMLFTDGAVDRYHTCLARWSKRRSKEEKVEEGTEEHYDGLVMGYLRRCASTGIKADRDEYISMMTAMSIFPLWYGVKRVPDWKRHAERLGIEVTE